ncbi:hypothetical protein TRICHSKD4_2734 [Roseibium sp. TrichSKD4]|uniref:hypothetical protein n=1 Tax=Roseibium sp. TrichSKD4 TaxID=744980 RepID=UPI0001E5705A|nr:hypothetical protein [Roseibium sp. TrichSKD4]EFO31647.1 hypothetical protein TRICHSKD4_2734 [Roseibium sp. TrichSKD4]
MPLSLDLYTYRKALERKIDGLIAEDDPAFNIFIDISMRLDEFADRARSLELSRVAEGSRLTEIDLSDDTIVVFPVAKRPILVSSRDDGGAA